ncbi:MAG: hypothetical protein V7K54_23380 [Nostoc sp.]
MLGTSRPSLPEALPTATPNSWRGCANDAATSTTAPSSVRAASPREAEMLSTSQGKLRTSSVQVPCLANTY